LRKTGEGEPVHQICHYDICGLDEQLESIIKEKSRSFLPGTIIVPLDDYREVYFNSPKIERKKVEKGSYIYFPGDVPHGGVTYYDLNDKVWHPSVQAHLDSSLCKRGESKLDMTEREMEGIKYLPKEHCRAMKQEVVLQSARTKLEEYEAIMQLMT
jgi:hypothetical protein